MQRCDLHRHLGGSISCGTVANLLGIDIEEATKRMTYSEFEIPSYDSFFNKFKILDIIDWNLQRISQTVEDVVWRLKQERIDYSEIKFSVNKYLPYINLSMEETILWLAKEFDTQGSKWDIEIDLILCLKHGMDKNLQIDIGNTIYNDLIAESIAGIDIVGNERHFNADFYKPIFSNWHDAGKVCMAHVGEIDKKENVLSAINTLPLDRICHGIACADDIELAKKSQDEMIAFDVCVTSNIKTGVATTKDHPIARMVENGFIITVGTDDPVILDTNYDKELKIFKEITGLSDNEIEAIQNSAYYFSAKEITKRKDIHQI